MDHAEELHLTSAVPGLLPQLPHRALLGGLALPVEDAGRDLERVRPDGLAKLADQYDFAAVQGDHGRGSRMMDDLSEAPPPRLDDQSQQRAVEDLVRGSRLQLRRAGDD